MVGLRLSLPLHLRGAALLPAFSALSLFLLFVCPIYRPTATKMCMQVKHLKATRAPSRRNPKVVHLKSSAQIRKHNSKWIKDLNLTGKTSRREHKLFDIDLGNIIYSPKTETTKVKTNKWDNVKLKYFCSSKGTINKIKRQPMKRVKIVCTSSNQ